jgi:NitT/TauT family transport system substrate-binding protein
MLNRIVLAALALALGYGTPGAETVKVAAGQKGLWDTSLAVWGERAGFFRKEGLELEILYTEGVWDRSRTCLPRFDA